MDDIAVAEHLPSYTIKDYENWPGDWELINGIPYSLEENLYVKCPLGQPIKIEKCEIKPNWSSIFD